MKLIDYDHLTKTKTFFEYDHGNDYGVVKTEQNVTPILEKNKALYGEGDHRAHGMKESFLHVATIPNQIIEKWIVEDGINFFKKEHWPLVKRKLNDPEYRFLRTTRGRI